jgi:Protein of unknown function (DUF3995)
MQTLVIFNSTIFTFLAIIHVYWAFGGVRGIKSSLPTQSDGSFSFVPHPIITLGVALGLWIFALATIASLGFWNDIIDKDYVRYANGVISVIFALRAFGDFNYVGLTKKIKNTDFAQKDTRMYTPLCALIAAISGFITLNS